MSKIKVQGSGIQIFIIKYRGSPTWRWSHKLVMNG